MKILYVGGYSRSGSTLLGRVLGEPPGALCVGETRYLWSRGLTDNVECGCGVPFRACPFWSAVGEEAYGGWDRLDVERLTEVDRLTNLFRALPLYRARSLRPGLQRTIDDYAARLATLYGAIVRVSGASTIVETSKDPTFACLLMRMPDSDIRTLHLVRDARAVAYSWTRRRRLLSPIGGEEFMPRFPPAETAAKWLAWNAAFNALGTGRAPYLRLTYESFVADPRGVLGELSAFADESLALPDAQLTDTEVQLGGHHIFSGNPMRTRSGRLAIRLDTEWRTALSPAQLTAVTAIAWPLLHMYGYPTVPRAATTADEATDGVRRD